MSRFGIALRSWVQIPPGPLQFQIPIYNDDDKRMQAKDVKKELQSMADPEKAVILQRFFKTGPGQYGDGDIFIGVMVPQSRQAAKKFSQLPLQEIRALLYSGVHEERLV